ncbi:MAG: ABC transporter substrate-binding protein [Pirellulales bacterium]
MQTNKPADDRPATQLLGGARFDPGPPSLVSRRTAKLVLAALVVAIFAACGWAKSRLHTSDEPVAGDARPCRRIISMAPSVTETLFALGLGDRVVGVSQFCDYPPRAKAIAKVGGYFDPNFEAIVSLKPDLVVMLVEHEESQPAFKELGIRTLVICHQNVEGTLASLTTVGRVCGAESAARRIVTDIERRMERIRRRTAGLPAPRVLFVIDRPAGGKTLGDVYVAGSDGFIDRLIVLAGGRNACPAGTVRFPVVSAEGILHMNPDVIIDLVRGVSAAERDKAAIAADWEILPEVNAVKNHRVYVFDDDYAVRPGPRFILLAEKLARALQP